MKESSRSFRGDMEKVDMLPGGNLSCQFPGDKNRTVGLPSSQNCED